MKQLKLACIFGGLILSPLIIACGSEVVLAPGELDKSERTEEDQELGNNVTASSITWSLTSVEEGSHTRGEYYISFKNWSTEQGVGFEFFLFFYDAAGNEVARTETAQFFTLARIEQRYLGGNFTLNSVKTVDAANRIKRMEVVLAP
ncbi:MAG: hypothetical protein Ct9H300mP15_08310 [Gemmatimonadota bacterium]|nr:MAG: hypothetical protein Ct9H300mP15_08310 [Gemmatimonadota bacterium]